MRTVRTTSYLNVLLASVLLGAPLATGCGDDTKPVPDTWLIPDKGPTPDAGPDLRKPDGPLVHKALTLKVAHFNDSHAQVEPVEVTIKLKNDTGAQESTVVTAGGWPRIVSKVAKLRTAAGNKLLVLSAGDVFQGTLYFTQYLGTADRDFLDMMKLDAMALGNHEFDRGTTTLADFIKKATFPVLSANTDASKDAALKDQLKPYAIKDIDGEKVAIIGVITPDTSIISSPGANVTFTAATTAVKDTIAAVEKLGANKIILLSHLGFDADMQLAKDVDGIDVIVSGHTHTLAGEWTPWGLTATQKYPEMVTSTSGKSKTCIAQAWEKTKLLGTLDVELDKDGVVTKCGGNPVMLISDLFQQYDAVQKKNVEVSAAKKALFLTQVSASNGMLEVIDPDGAATAKLATLSPAINALKKLEIADVTENLWHVRIPGTTHTTSGEAMPKGSYIAPHIAESFMWRAAQLGFKPQAAVVNAGAARIDIPIGKLTVAKVYELQPFANTLFVLKLKGSELKAQLDASVETATKTTSPSTGAFPYVAGIRYTADMTKAVGARITTLEWNDAGTWKAVEDAPEYTVATVTYLAGGGDGYTIFKNATSMRQDTGHVDAEFFIEYAKAKTPLKRLPTDTGVTFIK